MSDDKLVAIELLKPHRHAGRDYPPGAVLRLQPDQAKWLCALGRARPADIKPATATRANAASKE